MSLRLMMDSDVAAVARVFTTLVSDAEVGAIARNGLAALRLQFGAQRTPGTEMAVAAFAGAIPESQIRALAPAYVAKLSGAE